MKINIILALIIISVIRYPEQLIYCDQMMKNKSSNLTSVSLDKNDAATISGYEWARRQGQRNGYEREGWLLAKQGRYEEAIAKFELAADESLIVQEHERAFAIGSIVNIYQREEKFEQALQVHQWFMRHKDPSDMAREKKIKLLALIKARDIKNNKPIYEYINYVKAKYPKYFPPNGYLVGMSDIYINDFIHLYDYLHDYDAGIALMDEIMKYHANHKDPNHRSAHAKDVAEYTRVKQAWELDKKTGKHGHLQDVIKTSDFISW